MLTLPTAILQTKNALYTPSAWLVLLDIILSDDYKFYFVANNENITFDGQEYTAFPFELDESEQSTSGNIPTLKLRVANVTQVIMGYIEELEGGMGAQVTVRVVNSGQLAEDCADLEATYDVLQCEATAEWIAFTLGAPNPLRRRYPPNRHIATTCNWLFKSVECAYAGAETTCARNYAACSVLGNTARFGGYIGLSQKGWKVA